MAALLLAWGGAEAADAARIRSVLLLHAETRLAPGIVSIDQAFRTELQRIVGPIRFYSEYLDASWFPDARVEDAVIGVLLEKYANRRIDLVVPVGPAAMRLALRHRARIFPDVPLVFAAGMRSMIDDRHLPDDVTGTWLEFDWPANLALIARLHPETRRLAFAYGLSAFDRAELAAFDRAFADHRGRLELVRLTDLTYAALLEAVAALPADTVVLLFSFLRDRDGEAFITADVVQAMSRVARVPIYALSDTLIETGAVGGHVVSFAAVGRRTAALAASLLSGSTVTGAADAEPLNAYMFNARALERSGVSEARLPPGSILLHRRPSTWERFRWPILGGAALAAVEGALIVMLLVQRRQRTRAQQALARSFDLARLVSEISATLAAVSPAEAQRAIRPALRRVAHALHFDRASVIELTEDPRVAVTDSVAVPGGEPLPGTLDVDRFPWTVAALKRGDVVQWSSRDRIPAAAEQDRSGFAGLGTESFVAVPLIVGQTAVGAFSLSSATPMSRRPEPLIEQLRLLGEVFAHVIVRRRAEATIRESEERFRLMSDSAPVMIWMADVDGACTYCNRPWLEFTGRRLEDELRDDRTHGIHPDDRPFFLARYRAHLAARTPFLLEYRLRRHDGAYRSVVDRGIPRFAIDGTFSGYVGACSDITEIKQAHATMLETLALRGAIFGSLYGHVAAVDRAGVIVAVNESWSRFQAENGRDTLRPPIGANYLVACHDAAAGGDASAHQVEATLRGVLERRATRSSCEYVTQSDGDERWFEMTVEPFTRAEGGAIVTHIDITRRRRAEAEARREHEQLTHALRVRAVGELTASLAHEISQPLAAILSNAQAARLILEKQERFDDDVHGALTDIASDAKRAAHVIHRLRALFRNEWSEQRMRIDVNGVLADATSLLRTEFETKGVRLQLALGTPLPAVFGDAVQLQQVILNVVVNAVEAMVSAASTDPVVSVTTMRTGQGTVEVTISDHGPGVPDDQRDRIFEPFVTTKHTGLGMGLSISRSIIQAHDGRIWVTANGDRGLRVHIELPCEEQEDEL